MGFLDGLLGKVLGGAMRPGQPNDNASGTGMEMGTSSGSGGQGNLIAILLQVLQQHGGLGGLLSQFQRAGYGQQADSWVSTGGNQPIDGDVLSQVLGAGTLDRIAGQLGLPRREAADQVASVLPDVVDRMTPQGSVPANSDDLVARALEIMQRGGR
jgi:uncharacterized protein YidB (DUF937 family)